MGKSTNAYDISNKKG